VVDIDKHLPALMRSIFQIQTEVTHIYLGSRQHLMRRVFTDANQPLYRSATTGCHPHDAQELAYFAWELARGRDRVITSTVVDAAFEKVVAAEDAHYTTLWETLTLAERRVLLALSRERGAQVFTEAFRREHWLGAASTVQSCELF
jgi:hypothetical protein